MTLSLNEIEALAKTATRGAGYPWGLAEEAGRATRWLCSWSLDGCAELAQLLTQQDGKEHKDRAPTPGPVWSAPGGTLCPITAGAALSDHADLLGGDTLQMDHVDRPALLAPFAGWTARHLKASLVLTWEGARLVTDGTALSVEGDSQAACASVAVAIRHEEATADTQPTATRARPDDESLSTLKRFAHRTYAPATAASRLSGAGAGLTDND